MSETIEAARQSYAEELRFTTRMRSQALLAAFATVPRERFLGPGPWRVKSPWGLDEYWTTRDADPRSIYHDVLVALDEARGVNNGQPSLWAFLFDRLGLAAGEHVVHLGCGTGYYTALMAELVGPQGSVAAIEIDAAIAERARVALAPWPQVAVARADGASASLEPADVIVASAGATHPPLAWINALTVGGRLLFPMTTTRGPGRMLLVTRRTQNAFAAHFLCDVGFIDFQGARDPEASRRLAEALKRDRGESVMSLRRDDHKEDESCWLHGDGWCLSCRDPIQTDAKWLRNASLEPRAPAD
ncbi:protein-L-isoaspartate O-methyltransferase [Methylocapsa sp. S129]|uniref:protein-L-isoaspartate O-methyltransferase family protein n=1 Tax=Methylocapsa sp. S129 TaxID=1641869 RepID=UPI00131C70B9|nr:methyltransferase domain-containing protein [Methylocapsa sp. S129]